MERQSAALLYVNMSLAKFFECRTTTKKHRDDVLDRSIATTFYLIYQTISIICLWRKKDEDKSMFYRQTFKALESVTSC